MFRKQIQFMYLHTAARGGVLSEISGCVLHIQYLFICICNLILDYTLKNIYPVLVMLSSRSYSSLNSLNHSSALPIKLMIPYSKPELYDCYTPYQSKLLENLLYT